MRPYLQNKQSKKGWRPDWSSRTQSWIQTPVSLKKPIVEVSMKASIIPNPYYRQEWPSVPPFPHL
jgi:hypothetical protein